MQPLQKKIFILIAAASLLLSTPSFAELTKCGLVFNSNPKDPEPLSWDKNVVAEMKREDPIIRVPLQFEIDPDLALGGRYGPLSRDGLDAIENRLLEASALGYVLDQSTSLEDGLTLEFHRHKYLQPVRIKRLTLDKISEFYEIVRKNFQTKYSKFRPIRNSMMTPVSFLGVKSLLDHPMFFGKRLQFVILRGETFVRINRGLAEGHHMVCADEDAYAAGDLSFTGPVDIEERPDGPVIVFESIYINNQSGTYQMENGIIPLTIALLKLHGVEARKWVTEVVKARPLLNSAGEPYLNNAGQVQKEMFLKSVDFPLFPIPQPARAGKQ